jgi:hypothetical protein
MIFWLALVPVCWFSAMIKYCPGFSPVIDFDPFTPVK